MADVVQEFVGKLKPSFSLPKIDPYIALFIGLGIVLLFMIIVVIWIYKTYKIKIIILNDLGNNAFLGEIKNGREFVENDITKIKLMGKHGDKINYPTRDSFIPYKNTFGFMRFLFIVHRDKNGDYRPFKAIINPNLVDYKGFIDKNKTFKIKDFLNSLFPVLKIDNLKMRTWYHLKVQETLNIYKEGMGEWLKKNANIMVFLFIIFALIIGAYLLLK